MMMLKKKFALITSIILFSINGAFLYAKEDSAAHEEVEAESVKETPAPKNSSRNFVQKLEWEEDPNALEYKLEIQSLEKKSLSKTVVTKDTFFEFSMPAGLYQYRVFAYDFLGRQASVTEWKEFTITKALAPEIQLEKDTALIPHNKNKDKLTVPVDIEKITEETKVVFVNVETGEEIEGQIEVETDEEGNAKSSEAVFPDVAPGKYKIMVTNPSGLSSESAPVDVGKAPKPDYKDKNIAILTGGLFNYLVPGKLKDNIDYGSADFLMSGAGLGFTLQYMPIGFGSNRVGLEGRVSMYSKGYTEENYEVACLFTDIDAAFVWRFNFADEKLGLNLKAGGGLTLITESIDYFGSVSMTEHKPLTFAYFNVNGGVSVCWMPIRHLILECGLNAKDIIGPDGSIIFITPYLSIGLRL